jgi:hypothetical protein
VLGRQRLHVYLKSPTVRLVAIVLTLHYVCVCQLFFATDVDRALAILGAAGSEILYLPATLSGYSWQGPVIAIVIAAALLAALWKSEVTGSLIERFTRRIGERNGWLLAILCLQCVFVAGMFFVDWAFQQEPPPVLYMAF